MTNNVNIEGVGSGVKVPVILQLKESGTAETLKEIIKDGIKESQKSLQTELQKIRNNVQEGFTTVSNGQATFTDNIVDGLKSVENSIDDIADNPSDGNVDKEKLETNKLKMIMQTVDAIQKVASTVINASETAIKDFRENGMKSARMFGELYEAGILLDNGFDITREKLMAMGKTSEEDLMSFYDIASEMRLTTEEALTAFQQHSQLLAKMRSNDDINSSVTLAKMHGSLLQQFGLNAKEASAGLKYFNDVTLTYNDASEMSQEQFINSVANSTVFMKKLALATGQSVDQIAALNKIREDEVVHAHLRAKDEKTYMALQAMGLSPKQIEAFMTGVHNEESLMATALDQNMSMIHNDYGERYRRGELTAEELLEQITQDKRFSKDTYKNMDPATLSLINSTSQEFAKALMSGLKVTNFIKNTDISKIRDIFNAIKEGNESLPEAKSIANLQSLRNTEAEIVKMYNAYDKLTTMTMDNAREIGGYFEKVAKNVAGELNRWANNESIQFLASSANTFKNTASSIFGGIVNVATGIGNIGASYMNYKTAKNLKNMVPPNTPPPPKFPKTAKFIKGAGILDAVIGSGIDIYGVATKGGDEVLREKRENGLQGMDWISPYRIGQQIGLAIGVDKAAESLVNAAFDIFSDSPADMAKKTDSMKTDTLTMSFEEWSKKYGEKNKYMYDTYRDNMLLKQTGAFDKPKNQVNTDTNIQKNENSSVKDTVNQNVKSEIKKETETTNKISETSTYLQNISTKILSNEVFVDSMNRLSSLQEQMLLQLKKITDMDLTLTDKAVASQGR